ncbi:hypothetical protein MHF_1161 [Mycoplasma haemofelis Ohio2]|uniref:Uncharacterized protein n=1 Tax=Mycoplasma haemofelis (strain Ohio2) TaxID=859194 RepID=F6FJP7_MYCHI|nr:hypothetical protein MHF_1161 [Mycoplasma haemofelis Ohio2]
MKALPTAAFMGLSAAGLGGLYKFHNLKPKTLREYLEWQGLRLLSESEENYWNAVLEENKDLIGNLGLDTSGTDAVKSWCKKNIDFESYDDLKNNASLLCVDNPKTVKGRIIQIDGNTSKLIQGGDEEGNQYKVAYVFRKHIDGFHALIGYQPEIDDKGKEIEDLEKAKDAFKKWCTESLDKPIDETLVQSVKTFCTPKGFSSIEELINRNGEKSLLLTENSNSEQLKSKYDAIKEKDSWKSEDSKSKGTQEDLKDWCTQNKDKKFHDKDVFSEIYPKFRFRCLKEDSSKN